MKTEDLQHLVLSYPGQRTSIKELRCFEEPDPEVGIRGCYIEVEDRMGNIVVLNDDGSDWIHPIKEDDEVDWNTIIGTFQGELFPTPPAEVITPREILKLTHSIGENPSSEFEVLMNEELDLAFGISLDTELEVS